MTQPQPTITVHSGFDSTTKYTVPVDVARGREASVSVRGGSFLRGTYGSIKPADALTPQSLHVKESPSEIDALVDAAIRKAASVDELTIKVTGGGSGQIYTVPVRVARTAHNDGYDTRLASNFQITRDDGRTFKARDVCIKETVEQIKNRIRWAEEDAEIARIKAAEELKAKAKPAEPTITVHGAGSNEEYTVTLSEAKKRYKSFWGADFNVIPVATNVGTGFRMRDLATKESIPEIDALIAKVEAEIEAEAVQFKVRNWGGDRVYYIPVKYAKYAYADHKPLGGQSDSLFAVSDDVKVKGVSNDGTEGEYILNKCIVRATVQEINDLAKDAKVHHELAKSAPPEAPEPTTPDEKVQAVIDAAYEFSGALENFAGILEEALESKNNGADASEELSKAAEAFAKATKALEA